MSSINAQPAPRVTAPVSDVTYQSPVKFSGTGIPGWRVHFIRIPIDGSDFGDALVDDLGSWEFFADLDPGSYRARGFQEYNRERSDNTEIINFTVS